MKSQKILLTLLTAGLIAFGYAGNHGPLLQVVGYVNVDLRPGFNLISNPLLGVNNSISNLFSQPDLPDKFAVYLLTSEGYEGAVFDRSTRTFSPPEVASRELLPGSGVFVWNPGGPFTLTFAGQVSTGPVTTQIRQGFSIVSSAFPRAATLAQMDFPAGPGDRMFFFNSNSQQFASFFFDAVDEGWIPALPVLRPGDAVIVLKRQPALWVQGGAAGSVLGH